MKKTKKLLSLLLALVMMLGVFTPLTVLADGKEGKPDMTNISTDEKAVTNSVTLHKMLMTKKNVKARKVTVNIAGQGEPENLVSMVVVQEDGKYYNAKDNSVLSTTADPDKKYIAAFASGTPVFPGYSGLDSTDYDGREIKNLTNYFGSETQMKDVFFAWQVKGKETTTIQVGGVNKTVPQYIEKADDSTAALVKPKFDGSGNIVCTTDIEKAFGGYTTTTGIKFDTSKLKGAFLIQEIKDKSKYQNQGNSIVDQRAVPVEITLPLVNSLGTVTDAHVYPKNVEDHPKIDKNFIKNHGLQEALKKSQNPNETLNQGAQYDNYLKEKAKVSADVGRVIPYEVKTLIAKDTSYEKLVWKDNMTNGLTYNKDLKTSKTYTGLLVTDPSGQQTTTDVITGIKAYKKAAGPNGKDVEITTLTAADYSITEDDKGFELFFTKAGLDKIAEITKPADVNGVAQTSYDVEVVLTYTATINGTTKVDQPEKNNIELEYGHKKYDKQEPKEFTPTKETVMIDKSFKDGNNDLDDAALEALVLSFTVYKDGNPFRTVTLDWKTFVNASKRTVNGTEEKYINLGDGVEFIYTNASDTQKINAFKGKIVGLKNDQGKTNVWSISERVAGYNPEYTIAEVGGLVTIVNKKDNDNPPPLKPKTPEIVTGGKKFVKTTDKDKTAGDLKRLMDARFVVKKVVGEGTNAKTYYLTSKADTTKAGDQAALLKAQKAYTDLIDKYNEAIKGKKEAEIDAAIAAAKIKVPYMDNGVRKEKDAANKADILVGVEILRKEYEAAFKTAGTLYEWKELTTGQKPENIQNVVILTSDGEGRFEIQGLEYGKYKLEEIKPPEKYAKIADQEFTVAEGSYKGDRAELMYYPNETETPDIDAEHGYGQQVKNKEVTIPQTGGMGTVIFTVVGVALMAGAVIAMKKNREEA